MLIHFDAYVLGHGKLQRRPPHAVSAALQRFNSYYSRDGESLTLHVADWKVRLTDGLDAAEEIHSDAHDAFWAAREAAGAR